MTWAFGEDGEASADAALHITSIVAIVALALLLAVTIVALDLIVALALVALDLIVALALLQLATWHHLAITPDSHATLEATNNSRRAV